MHCGEDFKSPVDADSGRPVENRHTGGVDSNQLGTDEGNGAVKTVAVLVAVFGLVSLPFVTPPGMTLFYVAAAILSGLSAAGQSSAGEAAARGGSLLAVTPVVLWFLSALVLDTGASMGGLVPAVVYAIVVSSLARQIG
jgi:hypothetical protein